MNMQLVRKDFSLLIIFACFSLFASSQPHIISCPLDTNASFEILIIYSQFLDSADKIQTKVSAYATPNWFSPESFMHHQTGESCTPFIVEFDNDKIYIYDSTGHYPNYARPDVANRYLLNRDHINSLRIDIRNYTNESVNLNEIEVLKMLNLYISYLEITCSMIGGDESKVKIDAKYWSFLRPKSLFDVKISVPLKESKKKLWRDLGRFESLEFVEIHAY